MQVDSKVIIGNDHPTLEFRSTITVDPMDLRYADLHREFHVLQDAKRRLVNDLVEELIAKGYIEFMEFPDNFDRGKTFSATIRVRQPSGYGQPNFSKINR